MRKRIGLFSVMLLAIMTIASVAVAAGHLQASTTDVQDTYWFADGTSAGGKSVLTRTPGMVTVVVEGANLEPGDAYTIWWVVFNNPAECSDECGEDDIFTESGALNIAGVEAAEIGIGNATGNIAKADGTAEFGAILRPGPFADTGHQLLFPAGLVGDALLTASGNNAEIHIVIQSHGQARGGPQLLSQLTYFEAGCTPFCEDVQFSVHKP